MDKEIEAQRSQYLAQIPIDNKWQNQDLNLCNLDLDFVNQNMTLERDLSHSGWGAEDEMVRSYHWLNGPEFEQTPGDSGEDMSLTYYTSWGHKESDTI